MTFNFKQGKTFFGLDVYEYGVLEADIRELPFYDYWKASAKGSTLMIHDGKNYVYIHDWEAFCKGFILNGEHRYEGSDDSIELIPMSDLDAVLDKHNVNPYTDEGAKVCRAWLKETGTTLYEVPKGCFSLNEAYALAVREGNKRLIANDLS